jgi:hypothetical protein
MAESESIRQRVLRLLIEARDGRREYGAGGLQTITVESGGGKPMIVTFRFSPEAKKEAPRHY